MVIIVRKMLIWKRIYHLADFLFFFFFGAHWIMHSRGGFMAHSVCIRIECGLQLQSKRYNGQCLFVFSLSICVLISNSPVCMPLLFTLTELLPLYRSMLVFVVDQNERKLKEKKSIHKTASKGKRRKTVLGKQKEKKENAEYENL